MEDFIIMDPDPNSIISFLLASQLQEPSFSAGLMALAIGLLIISALISAIDSAYLSFNRSRVKSLATDGSKRAEIAVKLDDKGDVLPITMLVGNMIANSALLVSVVMLCLDAFPSSEAVALTVAIVSSLVAILLFGEILPRVIGKRRADSLVVATAGVVKALVIALIPVSIIFIGFNKLIHKLSGGEEQGTAEEELITIVDEAEEEGVLETEEGNLIRSAIEFNDVCAGDILTPRVDICAISKDDSMQDIAKAFIENPYSRLPVYDEDMDDIVGVLHEKDFFIAYHNNNKTINKHLQKPVHVSEHIKIADLLQVLKAKKCHMAVVVDEFGGTMGIVTMEDIIEELIGDVWDEHDEVVNDYKELPDGSFIVKGSADLDDFFEKFGIELELIPLTLLVFRALGIN